jgi:DNA-binding MarR family transcriptional regulator
VEGDGRKTIIALSRRGDRIFKKEFPRHVSYLKERFDQLGAIDRDQAIRLLQKIHQVFS